MTLTTTVQFRGTDREVEFEYEGDRVVLWWLPDDTEHEDKMGGSTLQEQADMGEYLWYYLLDWWDSMSEYD